MAGWWKVKREISRVGQQFVELKPLLLGPINRIYYDTFLRKEIRLTEGNQPVKADIAVVLLYQPDGLLPSTFHQLSYFLQNDIAPVVVTNAALSEADRTRLEELSYLIIERPNFGYDFGGYRDAILELLDREVEIRNLFVLNDSIWFPVRDDCTLIETARSSEADLFGIFYTKKSKRESHWHFHSFFYRFGPQLVASAAFRDYWKKMPLYQGAKRLVIRQFEIKLTAVFKSKGFSTGSLYDAEDIQKASQMLGPEKTVEFVDYHLSADELTSSFFSAMEGLSIEDAAWEPTLNKIIAHRRFGNYFLHAHPWVFLEKLRSPIIKKNKGQKFVAQRDAIVSTGLVSELLPDVRDELKHWDD